MQSMLWCKNYTRNTNLNKTCKNKTRCKLVSGNSTCYEYKQKASK